MLLPIIALLQSFITPGFYADSLFQICFLFMSPQKLLSMTACLILFHHRQISLNFGSVFRASPSEFVIPFAKYQKAVYGNQISLGMRFRMMFETEELGTRRCV